MERFGGLADSSGMDNFPVESVDYLPAVGGEEDDVFSGIAGLIGQPGGFCPLEALFPEDLAVLEIHGSGKDA